MKVSYAVCTLSASPAPIARGVLETTPLPEFLIHAFDRQYDGTLVLQSPAAEKSALYFVRGSPAKARLTGQQVFLTEVLVDLGLVKKELAESTRLEAEAMKMSLGQLLKQRGQIDDASLFVALREQLSRQVLALCDLPGETQFGFFQENFLADWGPDGEWRVKPLPLLWRALVDHLPTPRVQQIAAKIQSYPLRLRIESPVMRYRMNAAELNVVNLLRARAQPLEVLADSGVGTPELVQRIGVGLLLTRQLQGLNDAREPVGLREPPESPASLLPPTSEVAQRLSHGPGRVTSVPASWPSFAGPPSRTPRGSGTPGQGNIADVSPQAQEAAASEASKKSMEEFRQEILRLTQEPPATFYAALGVNPDADPAVIRAEFFRLARRWHPDRLPPELANLRSEVTQIFGRMSEANQVLTDAARRADYDSKLSQAPDSEQRKVTQILEAVSSFQRAEVHLKRKDLVQALDEAKKAFEGDPSQADHLALYGHILGLEGGDSTYALSLLDRAVALDENNVRALWYRGALYKKLGRQSHAMRDFRAVVDLRPNHVEAQRELRLHEMRRRTGATPSMPPESGRNSVHDGPESKRGTDPQAKPGFLGRFLKK
jgi:tetratricopeptide (TPR) repeat protein